MRGINRELRSHAKRHGLRLCKLSFETPRGGEAEIETAVTFEQAEIIGQWFKQLCQWAAEAEATEGASDERGG